jgi:hypothetical protein
MAKAAAAAATAPFWATNAAAPPVVAAGSLPVVVAVPVGAFEGVEAEPPEVVVARPVETAVP